MILIGVEIFHTCSFLSKRNLSPSLSAHSLSQPVGNNQRILSLTKNSNLWGKVLALVQVLKAKSVVPDELLKGNFEIKKRPRDTNMKVPQVLSAFFNKIGFFVG